MVRQKFRSEDILGKDGAQFVKSHAIRTSTHEICVAITFLAGLRSAPPPPPLLAHTHARILRLQMSSNVKLIKTA